MRWRSLLFGVLLLAVVATTGCGRRTAFRRQCCDPPALLPVTPVPVTAASPCCPCP